MTPSPSAHPDALSAVLASSAPFALIARDESTVELLTGDVPFHGTTDTPLRVHHLQSPPPSVRARRAGLPVAVEALVVVDRLATERVAGSTSRVMSRS